MTKFLVCRTSTRYHDEGEKPCGGAVPDVRQVWDHRTFKSPEEYDAKFPFDPWHSRGTEHGFDLGPRGGRQGIKRRMGDEAAWSLELGSLTDLLAFVNRYGSVVLEDSEDDNPPMLEIYDGWRE